MESQKENGFSLDQTTTVILTVFAAVVILVVGWVLYRFVIASPTPTPEVEKEGTAVVAEDWPTLPATFTPVPSLAPSSTRAPIATPTFTPTVTPTPTPTPLPPPYWKQLGYLTSIEFTGTIVVEKERKKAGVGGVFGTDRILLMAVGRIQVGVDLSQIGSSDFEIDSSNLRVALPRAVVTSVELLPGESRIYDSQKSWAFSEYEGLEKEALEEARMQLRESVLNNEGMMSLAETLARLQLSEFLHKAGFEQVDIVFEDERN